MDEVEEARRRLRYEEAFVLQVTLAQRRRAASGQATTPRPARAGGILEAFDARLPFELTAGQREVGATIADEMAPRRADAPAAPGRGGLRQDGRRAARDARGGGCRGPGGPARPHRGARRPAPPHDHRDARRPRRGRHARAVPSTAPGSRCSPAASRPPSAAAPCSTSSSGDAGIVVGTHALLQENVDFFDLALVVVDEQHRFGVEQRDALRGKGAVPPHVLVMTATPIPRTVAMTVFGDLETSTLRELPAGRAPITTHVVPEDRPGWMARTWARVAEEVRGRAPGLRRVPAHRRRRRARRGHRPARRGGRRRRR